MLEQDIRFLAEELEKGKLIVFVGAGVSKNSGLPDWKELIKDYAEYRGIKKFTSKEYLTIPEEVFERYGSLKYYEIAEKRFSGKYFPNSIHRILKEMDLTYIITTNYDTLIEDEIKNLQVVSKDEDLPYTSSNKMLIKMHGDFKNKNIVLKKSDYDNYEKNFQLISTLIKGLFTTNTILFIGYSYNDVNVKQIMNWIKEILKEETRKAFLVEFTEKDDKEEENGEQINRISLKLLTENNDKVLYEDKKEQFNNNYEKTLTKFLSDIYNKKEDIVKDIDIEIYKNLNYLTEHNWRKLSKYSEIYIDEDWKRILNIRLEFKDIGKYEEMLFKSRIKKVVQNINGKEKEILIPFSEKEITSERKKQKENLEELIEIKETLDIESYSFLLNQKFIDFIPETEDKIIKELDRIFQKKDIDINNLISYTSEKENILDFLLVSGLNDRLPISFIEKLSNYKNEEFFKSLKQYKLEILWKYILNQENFDFSEFTENELEKFSKIGIKNLLEKNDEKLIKLVREYVFSKIKKNDDISNNNIVEAYFEWESEKNETKLS